MTFADFFKTINKTKVFDCNREELVNEIYKAAGCTIEISNTAKQWFKRNKPGQSTYYFPQYKIDKEGFIKYFEDNTADSWQILLEEFKKLEDTGVIDCNPTDSSAFYLSLLKQFYEILGFPWVEPQKERMLKIFNQSIKTYHILDFLYSDPSIRLKQDLVDDVDDFVSTINTVICEFGNSNEPLFDKIRDFTQLIEEYSEFLGVHMRPLDESDFYVPIPKINRLKFREEFISKIQDLGVLYNEIQNNNNDEQSS